MKTHTTNYKNTFILVAEDCPAEIGDIPKSNNDKTTVAEMQYEIISKNPYKYTSDDILFQVYADRNDLIKSDYKSAREQFFSKGQPCFRASPLTKRYGFGIHFNTYERVAIFGLETNEYQNFVNDADITKVKAMRTSKK